MDPFVTVRAGSEAGEGFGVESVAAAFKGARKKDVEGILDGFAALGVLTAFRTAAGWRSRATGEVR